jgi:hypothetical protein
MIELLPAKVREYWEQLDPGAPDRVYVAHQQTIEANVSAVQTAATERYQQALSGLQEQLRTATSQVVALNREKEETLDAWRRDGNLPLGDRRFRHTVIEKIASGPDIRFDVVFPVGYDPRVVTWPELLDRAVGSALPLPGPIEPGLVPYVRATAVEWTEAYAREGVARMNVPEFLALVDELSRAGDQIRSSNAIRMGLPTLAALQHAADLLPELEWCAFDDGCGDGGFMVCPKCRAISPGEFEGEPPSRDARLAQSEGRAVGHAEGCRWGRLCQEAARFVAASAR